MRKHITYLSVILLVFFGCKSKKHVEATTEQVIPVDYIELRKGACFGTCKSYGIMINQKGDAKYNGKLNVSKIGEYEKNIDDKELSDLWMIIESADLFKLNDRYDTGAEDMPLMLLRYSKNGILKEIHYKYMSPKVLKDIENKLEEISEEEGWKKL